MRDVAARMRGLLQRRGFLLGWLALLLGSIAACGLPLLEQPGYELGAALALAHGLTGGLFALAALRAERPEGDPLAAMAATAALLAVALAVPFAVAAARTWATGPCDPFATAGFYPLLTLPSSLLSVAAGGAVGRAVRRGWAQGLAWAAVVLAFAAHALLPLYLGPQVFIFSHLLGYLPGPLYDEELHLPPALYWHRLGTLLLAAGLLALAARPARGRWPLALGCALGVTALEVEGDRLGFRASDASLGAHLSGVRASAEVVLRHAPDAPAEQVERAFLDARFRAAQVGRFLGGQQPGPVTVWWYPSAADKQRWVGAAHTQFSKPWRREVHVNASSGPHPVLKHELVHALAAPFGAPPFGITSRLGGLLPNLGLVEGLAVAADNPAEELDLPHAAAAMKRQGLLPDVRRLMDPRGFYEAPAARAYTTAGAFVRFLVERHGAEAVRGLYARGDFEGTLHRGLAELATDFEAALDALPVEEGLASQALARFRRGSLFERPCAREVALLVEAAGGASAEAALPRWRRCRALQPGEPSHGLAEARALAALGRPEEAAGVLEGLMVAAGADDGTWSEAALERAALARRQGDATRARTLWEGILARHPPPPLERTALVWLGSLALDASGAQAVARYFELAAPARVEALVQAAAGGGWVVFYLLGRTLTQTQAGAQALPWLERTVADPGCPQAVAEEARRLAVDAAGQAGQCEWLEDRARDGLARPGLRARAAEALERCRFARAL